MTGMVERPGMLSLGSGWIGEPTKPAADQGAEAEAEHGQRQAGRDLVR